MKRVLMPVLQEQKPKAREGLKVGFAGAKTDRAAPLR